MYDGCGCPGISYTHLSHHVHLEMFSSPTNKFMACVETFNCLANNVKPNKSRLYPHSIEVISTNKTYISLGSTIKERIQYAILLCEQLQYVPLDINPTFDVFKLDIVRIYYSLLDCNVSLY